MWGNFEQFCSFRPKLPCIQVRYYCTTNNKSKTWKGLFPGLSSDWAAPIEHHVLIWFNFFGNKQQQIINDIDILYQTSEIRFALICFHYCHSITPTVFHVTYQVAGWNICLPKFNPYPRPSAFPLEIETGIGNEVHKLKKFLTIDICNTKKN